jgi:hypothetical protein
MKFGVNFKMTTCEGQNFIETLWETIFSSLQQFQTEIASLAFGQTHLARNFVFFPL